MANLDRHVTFKGLIPALDHRQLADPFIIEGQNFLLDAEGPYSAFGAELLVNKALADYLGCQTFHIENDTIVATKSAFLKYDITTRRFYPIFTFTALTEDWVWSMAKVGGKYYFAYKGLNLIQYTVATNVWAELTTGVPTTPVSVTQSSGRLIVLGVATVGWSAIDDGEDLTTSTVTGAGQQALSIVGSGKGLLVLETADGYIAYTKSGLLKAENVDAVVPFRHYRLITENHPLSPFCISLIGTHRHVYLAATGFYQTAGDAPEVWQPIMSEYFVRDLLINVNLEDTRRFRLTFLEDIQLFFISMSNESAPDYYTSAYALYVPSNQFGMFNRTHTGLGHFALDVDPDRGNNYGFVDTDGYVFKFTDTPHVEDVIAEASGNYLYRDTVEIPCFEIDGIVQANSLARINCVDESVFNSISGYYVTADFVTVAPLTRTFSNINAYIAVGLFHEADPAYEDSVTNFSDVVVGMGQLPTANTVEDWLTSIDPDEDWLLLTGDEDWGIGVVSNVDYTAILTGTLDGYVQWLSETETLIAVNSNERFTQFAANVNGIFGILKFTAQSAGQSFHLKLLGVTGTLTGRL